MKQLFRLVLLFILTNVLFSNTGFAQWYDDYMGLGYSNRYYVINGGLATSFFDLQTEIEKDALSTERTFKRPGMMHGFHYDYIHYFDVIYWRSSIGFTSKRHYSTGSNSLGESYKKKIFLANFNADLSIGYEFYEKEDYIVSGLGGLRFNFLHAKYGDKEDKLFSIDDSDADLIYLSLFFGAPLEKDTDYGIFKLTPYVDIPVLNINASDIYWDFLKRNPLNPDNMNISPFYLGLSLTYYFTPGFGY